MDKSTKIGHRRPVTLFTGQWADLPLEEVCKIASEAGYDGLELACWGDHFEVIKADANYCQKKLDLLSKYNLKVYAISNHLVGQAVCDIIDQRHQSILPAHVWGNGDHEEVQKRAANEMIKTAIAAKELGVNIVNGFTGSSIWKYMYAFPPTPDDMIQQGYQDFAMRWKPILNEFLKLDIKFALEVHPTEIAFDIVTTQRALDAINQHKAFGFNYDPSHLAYQGVDYVNFLELFSSKIFHMHVKDVRLQEKQTRAGIFGGHLPFGDYQRKWNFCSPGRGNVNFEDIIRSLNRIQYHGPLSVEWEDAGMDRIHGASEACRFIRNLDFIPSEINFESAFIKG